MRQIAWTAVGVLMAAALLLSAGHTKPETARAQAPGMSLSAPDLVFVGQTFPVTISTDSSPDVAILGFAAEVLFPPSLEYRGDSDCASEVLVSAVNRQPLQFCLSLETGPGGRGINVSTVVGLPPLPALDLPVSTSGVALVMFDFTCRTAGSHTVTLASNPPSGNGAVYADVNAVPIRVQTEVQDSADVADTLTITCEEPSRDAGTPVPPAATDTPMPPAATDTPTVGPSPTSGIPTSVSPESDADSDGTGIAVSLLAVIAAAVAVAALALGGAAWYARKRWLR